MYPICTWLINPIYFHSRRFTIKYIYYMLDISEVGITTHINSRLDFSKPIGFFLEKLLK